MNEQIALAIPLLVIFVMTVVGTDLRLADFQRVRRYPMLVPGIVIGQWMLLPAIAGLAGWLLNLPPAITGGAILFAAAPVAGLSGYYTRLAGGDLALAVTVAAVSNLLSAVITPLAASFGFQYFLGSAQTMELPVLKVAQQTVIGLLLPLLAGMLIRRYATRWIARWRGPLQGAGLIAIAVIVGLVIADQFAVIRAGFAEFFAAALALTLAKLATGYLVVNRFARHANDRLALLWSFPARNIAIATLTATTVLGQTAVISFLAVLFVTQISLLLPLALWLGRRRQHRNETRLAGQNVKDPRR